MEDEDRALLGPKTLESALERVAVSDVPALVGDGRRGHRSKVDLDRTAPPAPNDVERRVDGQAMKPVVDAFRVAERRKVAPRSDVRILDRVAGELRIAQDQPRDGFEPRDRSLDELREGVMIAPPRPLREFPLVHAHPR